MKPERTVRAQRIPKKAAIPAPPPEHVTLLRAHEHAGHVHPAGAVIAVHPPTARWLRAAGVVSPLPSSL